MGQRVVIYSPVLSKPIILHTHSVRTPYHSSPTSSQRYGRCIDVRTTLFGCRAIINKMCHETLEKHLLLYQYGLKIEKGGGKGSLLLFGLQKLLKAMPCKHTTLFRRLYNIHKFGTTSYER